MSSSRRRPSFLQTATFADNVKYTDYSTSAPNLRSMSARLTRALGYAALAPSRPNPQGLLDYAFTEETLEAAVEAVAFDSARSLALLRNNHKLLEAIYEFFNTFDLHEPDAEIPKETIEDWKNLLYEDVFQNKSALDFTTALNKHVKSFKKLLQDPSGSEFIKHYTILASLPFAQMYMDQPIITAHEAAKVWRDAVLESTTASTYPESLYEFQVSHLERREANRKILDDLEKSIDLSNDDELSVSIRNIFDKKTEFETEVMEELTPHLSSRGTTAYMNPNFGKSPAWSKVEVSHSDQDAGDHAMTGDYATADGKQPMTESHMMTEKARDNSTEYMKTNPTSYESRTVRLMEQGQRKTGKTSLTFADIISMAKRGDFDPSTGILTE